MTQNHTTIEGFLSIRGALLRLGISERQFRARATRANLRTHVNPLDAREKLYRVEDVDSLAQVQS